MLRLQQCVAGNGVCGGDDRLEYFHPHRHKQVPARLLMALQINVGIAAYLARAANIGGQLAQAFGER